MNERDTGWSPAGYRGLWAAILKGGFMGVVRPHVDCPKSSPGYDKRVRDLRIDEWLFLWSPRAELYAECINFPLEAMRLVAWEEGVRMGANPASYQSPPFRRYPELAAYAPYRLEERLLQARDARQLATAREA